MKNITALIIYLSLCPSAFAGLDFNQNIKLNTPQAFNELKKYSQAGDAGALYFMGRIYSEGRFNKKINIILAYNYYLRSANKGFAKAQFEVASINYKNNDYKSAFSWFLKAAKKNHFLAFYNVAFMYEKGIGVKTDIEQAKYWYKKSSILKFGRSTRQLGLFHLNGTGFKANKQKAIELLETAYGQGDKKSLSLLKKLNVDVSCISYVRTFFLKVPLLCANRSEVRKLMSENNLKVIKEDDKKQYDIYFGKIFSKYDAKIAFGYTAKGSLARATALIKPEETFKFSDLDYLIFDFHKAYIKKKRHLISSKEQFEYIMSDGIHVSIGKDAPSNRYFVDYRYPENYRIMKSQFTIN